MSNIQIANQYAKQMASMTTADGSWISDNLPTLSRGERKAIIKVYNKYWGKVKYDPSTGVCVCSNPKV